MGAILFNIFIIPLEFLIEFVFELTYRVFPNPGICIFSVSLVVNLLVLPLYKKSDAIQEQEREKQKAMAPEIAHIKKTFSGDERVMMLNAYYRHVGYKPLYAVKGSLSLLFQIPFFIAAYHFLSNLSILQGISFWFLQDLSEADGLLQLGELSLNLMPILMTAINILSGIIYTKGFSKKEKFQLYGMALIFLILLYNSPSGLVLYWTLNNLFSLCKNLFFKVIPQPQNVLRLLLAVAGPVFRAYAYVAGSVSTIQQKIFLLILACVCQLPWLLSFCRQRKIKIPKILHTRDISGKNFYLGLSFLTLFLGLYIPSTVVSASPAEFYSDNYGPLYLVFNTLSIYGGVFLWLTVFYLMAENRVKATAECALWLLTGLVLVDFFFFGDYGTMSAILVYDTELTFSITSQVVNIAAVVGIIVLFLLLNRFLPKAQSWVYPILLVGVVCIGGYNCVATNKVIQNIPETETVAPDEITPVLQLSTEGQNVIVFMLDRAIGAYVPYIFNEKPELMESFDGFVWYENTLTTGKTTNYASASLFGGYEYTAYAMNQRSDELLVDKHNEALSVLPVLFAENGYNVTVCDPPYAGYTTPPDLSIYEDYPNISAYNLSGVIKTEYETERSPDAVSVQKRNFFFHGIFRILPVSLQPILYDAGSYSSADWDAVLPQMFRDSYGELEHLCDLTDIVDTPSGCFLMLDNETTHGATILKAPDYSVDENYTLEDAVNYYKENNLETVNGQTMKLENATQIGHYCVNVASFIQLAQWFDYLQENGVYDNTRIILVSDHGWNAYQFENLILSRGFDAARYYPLLMVKDFDTHGELQCSHEFMTNADTPALATSGIIENPINPFTGNRLDVDYKSEGLWIVSSENWDVTVNNGFTFDTSDGVWYRFEGDEAFDETNWMLAGEVAE